MADATRKFFREALKKRGLNPNQRQFSLKRQELLGLIEEAVNEGEAVERLRALPWIAACVRNEIHRVIETSLKYAFDYIRSKRWPPILPQSLDRMSREVRRRLYPKKSKLENNP